MDKDKQEILEVLKAMILTYPQLRFGQIINNVLKHYSDLYFITDSEFLKGLKVSLKQYKGEL